MTRDCFVFRDTFGPAISYTWLHMPCGEVVLARRDDGVITHPFLSMPWIMLILSLVLLHRLQPSFVSRT